MTIPAFMLLVGLLIGRASPASAQELAPGWNPITPGGAAVCARGTPYTFFARPGDPDRLLFFFQGGGACWNDETCAPGYGWFDEVVEGGEADAFTSGIFDPNTSENPLGGWSTVFVTYCTGDLHTGNRRADYASGPVEHRGAVNAGAAIAWAAGQFPRARQVAIVGCSAGAFGSIYHAPAILRRWPSARAAQLGDAFVGVIPAAWGGFDVWGTRRATSPDRLAMALYTSAARSWPGVRFGQFSTSDDGVQTTYATIMGASQPWGEGRAAQFSALNGRANLATYLAPGAEHCITPTPWFYSEAANGTRFRDWFAALIGGPMPSSAP